MGALDDLRKAVLHRRNKRVSSLKNRKEKYLKPDKVPSKNTVYLY